MTLLLNLDLSGRAVIVIQNDTGFTERLNEGSVLGEVTDVLQVIPFFQMLVQ